MVGRKPEVGDTDEEGPPPPSGSALHGLEHVQYERMRVITRRLPAASAGLEGRFTDERVTPTGRFPSASEPLEFPLRRQGLLDHFGEVVAVVQAECAALACPGYHVLGTPKCGDLLCPRSVLAVTANPRVLRGNEPKLNGS